MIIKADISQMSYSPAFYYSKNGNDFLNFYDVMDDKKTIEQVIAEEAKKLGGQIEIVSYVRFEVGEGLEKKAEDFAAEVAAAAAAAQAK